MSYHRRVINQRLAWMAQLQNSYSIELSFDPCTSETKTHRNRGRMCFRGSDKTFRLFSSGRRVGECHSPDIMHVASPPPASFSEILPHDHSRNGNECYYCIFRYMAPVCGSCSVRPCSEYDG